jgi:hypothetical protein
VRDHQDSTQVLACIVARRVFVPTSNQHATATLNGNLQKIYESLGEIHMGSWGSGNFDSDAACDYLDSLKFQLIRKIEDCLASINDGDLADDCEHEVMASVDILSLLTEQYYGHHPRVEAQVVRTWKVYFLKIYDQNSDDDELALEYHRQRREVIEATFNKLEEQARKSEEVG